MQIKARIARENLKDYGAGQKSAPPLAKKNLGEHSTFARAGKNINTGM